ncbi:MAG: hypothetical protein WCL39_02800 [Armatimonadota bacterium]
MSDLNITAQRIGDILKQVRGIVCVSQEPIVRRAVILEQKEVLDTPNLPAKREEDITVKGIIFLVITIIALALMSVALIPSVFILFGWYVMRCPLLPRK